MRKNAYIEKIQLSGIKVLNLASILILLKYICRTGELYWIATKSFEEC